MMAERDRPVKPYYDHAGITIYHGDCRESLPTLPKVDLVLTDPPYAEYTHTNAKSNRGVGYGKKAIDFKAIEALLCELGGKCDRWFVSTLDWHHIAELDRNTPEPWEFVRFGVWVKTNPMPQISADRPANGWEGIAYLHNTATKKSWRGGGKHGNWIGPVLTDGVHPTGKPIEFISSMVKRFSGENEMILDPFMGSGTTLVAAKQLNRKAIGIEIEEKYCEIAAKRLEQEVFDFGEPDPVPQTMRLDLGGELSHDDSGRRPTGVAQRRHQ